MKSRRESNYNNLFECEFHSSMIVFLGVSFGDNAVRKFCVASGIRSSIRGLHQLRNILEASDQHEENIFNDPY